MTVQYCANTNCDKLIAEKTENVKVVSGVVLCSDCFIKLKQEEKMFQKEKVLKKEKAYKKNLL